MTEERMGQEGGRNKKVEKEKEDCASPAKHFVRRKYQGCPASSQAFNMKIRDIYGRIFPRQPSSITS